MNSQKVELYPESYFGVQRLYTLVVLIKIGERDFPILQIEMGSQNFDLLNPHKDISKMLGTMSLTCIEMAHELHKSGKRPEDARVFGIWIGGTTFQFCVAHPLVTSLPDGKKEIYANLIFKDEWWFDILSSTPGETTNFPSG